ncbi:XdhC family protein [Rhizobium helianthi]|uniref:XdhC family protein n=1 Tax=Rhizobium helianthi TaxID=1132695 RepID=A0ABW4LYY6_9HYPH
MELDILKRINQAREKRQAIVVLTHLASGLTEIVEEGEAVAGELASSVETAFRSGRSGLCQTETGEVFLNVHLPPPRIVAIGAVHITQVLARLAPMLSFDLTIVDPRTAFATPERFAGVDLIADWPEDVLAKTPLDAHTALAAVTHDPKIDDAALAQALRRNCFYVGALGSRKTHAKRVERLRHMGLAEEEIGRIKAPIGLDIGASTPEEIALAIMAEIVQSFRLRALPGRSA